MRTPGANIGCRLHGTSGISPVVPTRDLVPPAGAQSQFGGRVPPASGTQNVALKHGRQPASPKRELDVSGKATSACGILRRHPVVLWVTTAKRRLVAALEREAFFRAMAMGSGFLSAALMALAMISDH